MQRRPRTGWKRLIAGAFAICELWRRFLKFRSASAWGSRELRLQELARGEASRNLRVLEPQLIFAESVELEYPIVLLEPLAFLLNRMLEQVCARLSARALAVQELQLIFNSQRRSRMVAHIVRARTDSKFIRTLRLPAPMLDAKVFLKLLQLDLQAHPPGAPIGKVHLLAEPARPRALQSGLFQPVFPEPEKLELTLARIAGIVGEGRAGSVELLDTHRADAFTLRHFAPAEPGSTQSVKQPTNRQKNKDMYMSGNGSVFECDEKFHEKREENVKEITQDEKGAVIALRLFRPRLDAIVTLCEAKPVRMRCPVREDIAGEIVWTAGPWRSSGDWSEQEGWSREEWDIAISADSGLVLYRLVQDKLSGTWFVEGTYD